MSSPTPPHLKSLPSPASLEPRARILVVDDSEANLRAVDALLAPLGQEVVLARSGDEALRQLLHGDFAVILMDVQMPGLDGLETARIIRSRERSRHIPIIFVTALSREAAYVTRGYAEGGVDYLLKPVDPGIVRAKVSVFVELHLRGERLKQQAIELERHQQRQLELERASAFEQRLLGIVGHDIRTPLTSILAAADFQLLQGDLRPEQAQAFRRVMRGADRIAKIAELLMDFTRANLAHGIPLQRQLADLRQVCHAVTDEFRTAHPDRVFELDEPRHAVDGSWDVDRLAQVLSNLLDNAVKYGAREAPIRVELRAAEQGGAVMRIHNRNEGRAIPLAVQATLFEPFQRGTADDEHRGSSLGLGLYIAHEIVRAHGGTLTVRSDDATGTTFEVRLPELEADEDEEPAAQPLTA